MSIDEIDLQISQIEQKIEFARRGGRNTSQYIASLNNLKAKKEDIIWTQKRNEQNTKMEKKLKALETENEALQEEYDNLVKEFDETKKLNEAIYQFFKQHPEIKTFNPQMFVSEYEKLCRE